LKKDQQKMSGIQKRGGSVGYGKMWGKVKGSHQKTRYGGKGGTT